MVSYEYSSSSWSTFEDGIRQEWSLTNGIGGYAGSSLIGAHNRTHQGYLIASLHPPIERYLVFSKINEVLMRGDDVFSLETSQHKAADSDAPVYTQGQQYLKKVRYDGTICHSYEAADIRLERTVCLMRDANVCAITYTIENSGDDAALCLTPLFNYREHSASSRPEDLVFTEKLHEHYLELIPASNPSATITFSVGEGTFSKRTQLYDVDMQLQIEVDLEVAGLDCHYTPYDITVALPAGCRKTIQVICAVNEPESPSMDAAAILEETHRYYAALLEHAGFQDSFANQLVLASAAFLSMRESTGMKTVLAGLPWFTDWGRDTMIAYTGLTLCTRRFTEAKEILLTFAKYIHNGIVPNMFPDTNAKPLYNTVDASLWYFYAVDQYVKAVNSSEAYAFVQEEIFPHLKEIISAYENGTDFSIYMDTDGLIHAGSGLDQITWMDVRVGDWVATPRHGKPVEINALWYNALKVMEALAGHFGEDFSHYTDLAARVKSSFLEKFWWEEKQCLYDVVDGDFDDHIRPNQIYAVSLPYSMVPPEMAEKIVALVKEKLYVGCGLRSLSREHADYHGIYAGALSKRDAAYHQGTAWGFLLGGFLTAYLKVHDHSSESIQHAIEMLAPVREHLCKTGCIGSISEIFDGDEPHNPRGCYAQAWSVGEVLRAYVQDILPYCS